jgi:hypothetical protein
LTRRSAIERCIVFASALALYLYTLAPSVNWADAARMQMDVLNGGSTYAFLDEARDLPTDGHPFDRLGVTAWDHPLYVMLGHTFTALPLGSPPFGQPVVCSLRCLTIVLYELAALLTRDRWSALLLQWRSRFHIPSGFIR